MRFEEKKWKKRNWFWLSSYLSWIPFSPMKQKSKDFFVCIFSMIAKISTADGRVSKEEYAVLDRFMEYDLGLDSRGKLRAIHIFDKARKSNDTISYFAEKIYTHFRFDQRILRNVLDLLFTVAYSDSYLEAKEQESLLKVAKIFGIPEKVYKRLQNEHIQTYGSRSGYSQTNFRNSQPDDDRRESSGAVNSQLATLNYYQLLGCTNEDTLVQIKRKYRRLVLECHPDMLIPKGMPQDLIKIAERKFVKINHAYEEILKLKSG